MDEGCLSNAHSDAAQHLRGVDSGDIAVDCGAGESWEEARGVREHSGPSRLVEFDRSHRAEAGSFAPQIETSGP